METKSPESNMIENLAICKKDPSGRVFFQNEMCLRICGHREGQICSGNCMEKYNVENPRSCEGTFQFQNMKIGNGAFDVIMVNDGEQILTLLFDLTRKYADQKAFFKKFYLTTRENEVLSCVNKGMTNQEIADALYISKKTLKTHINNILKKIPREYWPREN